MEGRWEGQWVGQTESSDSQTESPGSRFGEGDHRIMMWFTDQTELELYLIAKHSMKLKA